MRIAIDVDEVLANLIDPVITYHNEVYQTSLNRENFTSYNFEDNWGGTREQAIQKMLDFFKTDHFARVQPMPGAVAAVRKLKHDHDLYVITSRQTVIAKETREWLEKYFPRSFKEVHVTNWFSLEGQRRRKKDICAEIGAELFIDDSWEYVSDCVGLGIPILMYDYPWNRHVVKLPANVKRVFSWAEIIREIQVISS